MTRKDQVLRYVNRLRETHVLGKPLAELPKGYKGSVCQCVLARALHADVDGDHAVIAVDFDREVITFPGYVRSFVRGFDAGRYPELVEAS